jgi:hypothetical protein
MELKRKKTTKFKGFNLKIYLVSWWRYYYKIYFNLYWNYRHLSWNNVSTIVVTSDNNNQWNLVATISCNNKPTQKITGIKDSWKNASTIVATIIVTIINYNNETTPKIARSKERLKNTSTIATKKKVTREEGKEKKYNVHLMHCRKLQGKERGCASHSIFITKC